MTDTEDTAASLLAKAQQLVANRAYDAARRYLERILDEFPDSPEASKAQDLLDKIEGEF